MADFLSSVSGFKRGLKYGEEQPIRDEIFSVERLEQYAQSLAADHKTVRKKTRVLLLPRLRDNGRKLVGTYQALVESLRQGRAISPAAEWLVDNFHIVEDQLREIREDLPRTYYHELPKLTEGELKDFPRIYALALALIAHTDSRLDSNTLRRFIAAYQTVSPLTIGEVWAVAITLRLGLVENLRRLAILILRAREEREQADNFADKLLELAVRQPAALVPALSEKLGKREKMPSTFVVQLVQRLREQDPALIPVTDWLENRLAQHGTSIEQVMHAEHQRQAATQVTVGDIITSMRLLSTLDWRDFFESVSLVDKLLGQDPAEVYLRMDFATRDRYRHSIERISKKTGASELDIAKAVVQISAKAINEDGNPRPLSHVGYYLIDAGLPQLEQTFSYRPSLGEKWRRWLLRNATPAYFGSLVLLTVSVLLLLLLAMDGMGNGWLVAVIACVLALVPASELVLAILNWDITHFLEPRLLPRMETGEGIPGDAHTMVVVPTIFFSEEQVHDLLEKLEVHFLANQDAHIHFALLSDFCDADVEELPDDSGLLGSVLGGIEDLNRRYRKDNSDVFHLFHRRRKYNTSERKWIGWERKRGKLHEFNQLLRGSSNTSFIAVTAEASLLERVRYVITLDSDTKLPREVARKLVGTAMHPLNQPRIDPSVNRVTYGYGILQPRVSISLESASQSKFSRLFSGLTGLDPYTTAVSDVYQDLFGEGSYTGKGLYHVDTFEATLSDRVPENYLLSHDLFESLFARAALITDLELFDDYPARYDTYAKRLHRWTRGDWQILRWLFPYVVDGQKQRTRNNLPLISRWKILDNLRRSLVAPSMFLWLLAAWTIFPGSPIVWSLLVLLTIALPVYLHVTTSLLVHPRGSLWSSHFWNLWKDIRTNTAQTALSVILLPHQAYLMTDAIVRTIYRKMVSRQKLLEWVTAAQSERESQDDLRLFLRLMWPAELLAIIAALLQVFFRPGFQSEVWLFTAAWAASPFIAYWISLPPRIKNNRLTANDLTFVRLVARRTWRFFETFVGPDDNWLPPDNFQEDPVPVVAHRTSPTNVGLLLLSTGAAHDFGYLSTLELVERLELTFGTLGKLTKFRGHFLNWYDTVSLAPLEPQYISTVDSGNLAGHLIALRQMCIELPDAQLLDNRVIAGFRDTIRAISVEAGRLATVRQRTDVVTVRQLRDAIEICEELVSSYPDKTASSWSLLLNTLAKRVLDVKDIIDALSHEHGVQSFEELRWWTGALQHQVKSWIRDVDTLAPWIPLTSTIAHRIQQYGNEAETQWRDIEQLLADIPSFSAISEIADSALIRLAALQSTIEGASSESSQGHTDLTHALRRLNTVLENAIGATKDLMARLARVAQQCEETAVAMDFRFLFDEERKLFAIGFNVSDSRHDNSFYDLLASEARIASFVAIARGNVLQEHWFRLGRQLTIVDAGRSLISWTGTMFEYLMPLLVTRSYPGTLLAQTYESVVARQIEYGLQRGVPWGISESAYNVRDLNLNYQYGPFGVPGLGLKRGLIEDLVVAPYATMLAAMVNPRDALDNLRTLERQGALGRYGYYEAIDYTKDRLPQNQKRVIIKAFMTHHQGMSLVALANTVNENQMENRFHADPSVRATELLLQERIPSGVRAVHPRAEEVLTGRVSQSFPGLLTRTYKSYDLDPPRTQLLSNGTYNVMLTTAGAGFSRCGPYAVTRWREDATRDNSGTFIYLRDVRRGTVWSAGYQPVQRRPQSYEVCFSEDKVDFWRSDDGIITHTEIVVSPEDNAEVRHLSLTNDTATVREVEVTSYSEVVLAFPQADAAHPAFSNLFVETEFFAAENSILAHRRQRSQEDEPVWGVHSVVAENSVGAAQYETDRARFLGRGHTTADPVAVVEDRPLSNTVGAVLDPIFSLRRRVRIHPNETVRISFSTALAHSREEAMMLADKYHDPSIFDRQARLAWTKAQVEMNHLKIDAEEAHLFQRLATRIIFSDPSLRPSAHVLGMNTKAQSALWPYALSGDLPILVVRISTAEDLQNVRMILRGHEYLHYKGLKIDLVVLNDHPTSYTLSLHRELDALIGTTGLQILRDKPGGVFLRRADIMPEADRILLHAVARAVVVTERGSLQDHLERPRVEASLPPAFQARSPSQTYSEASLKLPELQFFNGIGGFRQDGREYVIVLGADQWTPAPWTNVIANQTDFGFQVTETGAGYTWSVNSRENRLTPWSNDPVSDPPGEIIYLRDEETGTIWSPTPLPIREVQPYTIRHGQGYTVFEHTSHGISQELLVFVPLQAPVKVSLLRLVNRTDQKRRLSVTSYTELVLGVERNVSAPYLITEIDAGGTIYARNPFNNEFGGRVTFLATNEPVSSSTCDRKEFLGRNGSVARPAALSRVKLAGRDGAGLDPCGALQTTIDLRPFEAREIVFIIGEAPSKAEAAELVSRFRNLGSVNEEFEKVLSYWDDLLGVVEIQTPDEAMDKMLNRWLLYQTLSCRIWARSAFYQSGGAFGFRDQLQDVMALAYCSPATTRHQILLAASHQFKEGDVLHWWHPPTGRGVRTRFSDDLLWLPFVTASYVNITGDLSVLDEDVPFIESPLLNPGQQELYLQPVTSAESGSIFEHCIRAIDRSLAVGQHGLPLMGSGDWNDGMNRVGHLGKGESVWVGWFLYTILSAFVPLCQQRRDQLRTDNYRQHLVKLKSALEENGWDGDWYRRAFFDDGTPLGSAQNEECRIDSIVQSWGVISGAADHNRQVRSMSSVEEYLIRRGDGLVVLFTPPFDDGKLDPGYIKGYVPGVRENGGQYTHAAIWAMIAFTALGDGERAGELFSLLNPINHASTRAGLHKYKVEPYVAVGDVYAVAPHTGRGGWTWYTGSAGWMYRAGLESILGFKKRGNRLTIDPCIPRWWREYQIIYRFGKATYRINVENPLGISQGVSTIEFDGLPLTTEDIPLSDDNQTHQIRIVLGEKPPKLETQTTGSETSGEQKAH